MRTHVPLLRGRYNSVLVLFNSNAVLKLTWVSKIENCQEPFFLFVFLIVLLWAYETS